MREEVVEGVPGKVQRSAGLVRVEQPDHVHAKVALQPLHVGVGSVKHLGRAWKTARRRGISKGVPQNNFNPNPLKQNKQQKKTATQLLTFFFHHKFGSFSKSLSGRSPRSKPVHRFPRVCESQKAHRTPTSVSERLI